MKTKSEVLVVTFSDGSKYEILTDVIRQNRAQYYAEVDGIPYEEALGERLSEDDILDWVNINMSWNDVAHNATLVKQIANFEKEWCNAEKKIK